MKIVPPLPMDQLDRLAEIICFCDAGGHGETTTFVYCDGTIIFTNKRTEVIMRRRGWVRRADDPHCDILYEPSPKARRIFATDSRVYPCGWCKAPTAGTPARGGERWEACPVCIATAKAERQRRNLPVADRPSRMPTQFHFTVAGGEDALRGDHTKLPPKLMAIVEKQNQSGTHMRLTD